jgi:4-amino-4-deoxy-L-arabinose transferase-like glycosyltransferase
MTSLTRAGNWIDTHERQTLAALIAFYALIVSAQSAIKLLWVDELITFQIARQPGLSGIWRALRAGADPNPPLIHILVQTSVRLLGESAFAIRLPAILGVMLAIVAMWWMLRRWVRPVFAAAGVLAFMATRGFDYAYDARSYALLMGFAMASLALWIRTGDVSGWRRTGALGGMALALAAGISSNYYGVLAFFPIAAGELVTRRFRLGVWLAMLAGSLPLLAYLPLIRNNIAEFAPHAWNRPQISMIGWSYLELVEGVFWPVLGLGLWVWWRGKISTEGTKVTQRKAEMAAVGVLLVYPVIGFAVAVGGAGMISPRCVVPVCCGFGLSGGVLAQSVFGRSARVGMAIVLLMVVWVGVRQGICANLLLEQRQAFFALRNDVKQTQVGQILVADSSFALPLHYYSDRDVRRLSWFPIDFEAIHQYERDDSGEQNL